MAPTQRPCVKLPRRYAPGLENNKYVSVHMTDSIAKIAGKPSKSGQRLAEWRWCTVLVEEPARERAFKALAEFLQAMCHEDLACGVTARATVAGELETAAHPTEGLGVVRLTSPGQLQEFICLPLGGSQCLLGQRTLGLGLDTELTVPWWAALKDLKTSLAPEGLRLPPVGSLIQLVQTRAPVVSQSELRDLLELSAAEANYLQSLVQEQSEELHRLRERVKSLMERDDSGSSEEAWSPQALHWGEEKTLEHLELWCLSHRETVEVAPRAHAGAKKSIYKTPGHVYKALNFLAGPYWQYRTGKLSKEKLDEALAHSGCQLAGSVGMSVAGELGDTYFIKWNGRRRFLDMHLLRGGGRDERYCMRVYFFWDDELKKTVVGWLPSHLNNSLS